MRKTLFSIVAGAAMLASSVAHADPRVVLSLKLFTNNTFSTLAAPAIVCDSNVSTICSVAGAYTFTYSTLGGTSGWTGQATLGNFLTFSTSFAGNAPGSEVDGGLLSASQNDLRNIGVATGYLQVDLQAFDYTAPAGTAKYLQGSASLTQASSTSSPLDKVVSTFYADGDNDGGFGSFGEGFGPSCTITGALNNSCNTGAPQTWLSSGGPYSMRDVINYTLTGGDRIQTTSTGVVLRVPEPASVALVGLALFAAGAASVRRGRKA